MEVRKKYEIIPQRFDKHVVIPDLHGESKLLEQVIDRYDNDSIGFVLLGDVVDQKGNLDSENNVYKLLDTVKSLGSKAILTMANHEFILLGALEAKDPYVNCQYTDYWHMIENNVVSSYGLYFKNGEAIKESLRDAMRRVGHLAVLNKITMYYETDDFIATHAGVIPNIPWEQQKDELNELAMRLRKGDFPDYAKDEVMPQQIFSLRNATSSAEVSATDKVVVSGHAHFLPPTSKLYLEGMRVNRSERILHNGKRIRLASQLNRPTNDDLFIWRDWDGQIEQISNSR
jgi:hypothetical protein